MPEKTNRSQLLFKAAGLAGILVFSFVLIIKRDGYFPFPQNVPVWQLVAQDILLLALLVSGIYLAVKVPWKRIWGYCAGLIKRHPRLFLALLTILLICAAALLLWISAKPFAAIYTIDPYLLLGFSLVAAAVVLLPLFKKATYWILVGLVIASVLLYLVPVLTTPITAKLGDLMPIVIKQGQAFLSGQNIYQFYLLDNGVLTQAVRQPGIMLLYLPAVAWHFDPRLLSLLYQLGGGALLLELVYPGLRRIRFAPKFIISAAILALYLLLPYRILRSDLYDPPYWFLMLFSLWALFRKKYLLWAVVTGIAIFTQIWSWILLPFLFLYLYRQGLGWKRNLLYTLICLLLGAGVLALFIIPDPQVYFSQVFGFYNNSLSGAQYPAVTIFLTPLVFALGWGSKLQLIQFLGCALIGILALWKLRTFRQLLVFAVAVTMLFIQFNIISWDYMYLTVLYLLILYVLVDESHKSSDPGRRPGDQAAPANQGHA